MPSESVPGPYLEALLDSLRADPEAGSARLLDLRIGLYWTAVQTTRGIGIASTLGNHKPGGALAVPGAGTLHERSPLELAAGCLSSSVTEASLGLAAVNSLLGRPPGQVSEANAEAIIRDRGQGRQVAVIGHFPFIERLRPCCSQLWVFERGSRIREGDLGADSMAELLPAAEVVAISATTLINHTLAGILELVDDGAFTLMLGPSTPMARCLLALGFDVLCGTWISCDPLQVLAAVSQGAVLRQIPGCQRLACWPSNPGQVR